MGKVGTRMRWLLSSVCLSVHPHCSIQQKLPRPRVPEGHPHHENTQWHAGTCRCLGPVGAHIQSQLVLMCFCFVLHTFLNVAPAPMIRIGTHTHPRGPAPCPAVGNSQRFLRVPSPLVLAVLLCGPNPEQLPGACPRGVGVQQ